jgi:hypothetical protein
MAAATVMAYKPLFERTFRMLHHPEGQNYPEERTPAYYVVVIVLSKATVTCVTHQPELSMPETREDVCLLHEGNFLRGGAEIFLCYEEISY